MRRYRIPAQRDVAPGHWRRGLNAIGQAAAAEMQLAFKVFDADADKRAAILSAAGNRAFSSGADVNDLPELWRAIPNAGFQTDTDYRRDLRLGCRRRHRHGNDMRPDGFHRGHPVQLPGGKAGHNSRRDQFPGGPHAAQTGHGGDASRYQSVGPARLLCRVRPPRRAKRQARNRSAGNGRAVAGVGAAGHQRAETAGKSCQPARWSLWWRSARPSPASGSPATCRRAFVPTRKSASLSSPAGESGIAAAR